MPFTNDQRDYSTGSSLLELSGAFAGPLLSMEGGDATSDVIQEKLGSDAVVRKHLGGLRYTDLELECDARMESNLFDWIRDTLNHKFTRKSGVISFSDFSYQVDSRVEFSNALLTGVSFPALDAESKAAATMTVKLAPEYTRRGKGSGQPQSVPVGSKGRVGWTAAKFRLAIDALPDCSAVTKIEPLMVTSVVAQQVAGEARDYQHEPAQLNVPDLVLTLPESKAASFYAWHEDFVVKGMNGPQYEKNGTLEFLGPNEKDVLLTLELKNLGIFRLTPVSPPSTGGIAQVRASMYCEEITLGANGIIPPASSPSPPRQEVAAAVPVAAPAGAAVPVPPGANAGEPTPMVIAREPGELMRTRPVDVQTEQVDVPADDGVGRTAATATSLGTVVPGGSITFSGVRGPSKPAWFHVTLPCNDSCTARVEMQGGPAFDLYASPQMPLATGLTIGDVFLSPAQTQLLVNVPAGPSARYTLAISRPLGSSTATSPVPSVVAAGSQAGTEPIVPANGGERPHDLAMTPGAASRFLAPYHLTSFGLSDRDVMTTFPVTLTVTLDRSAEADIQVRLFLDRTLHGGFVVRRGSDTGTTLLGTSTIDLGQHTLTVRLAGEPGDDNEELSRTLTVSDHLPAAFHQPG